MMRIAPESRNNFRNMTRHQKPKAHQQVLVDAGWKILSRECGGASVGGAQFKSSTSCASKLSPSALLLRNSSQSLYVNGHMRLPSHLSCGKMLITGPVRYPCRLNTVTAFFLFASPRSYMAQWVATYCNLLHSIKYTLSMGLILNTKRF